jgi:hypothetical protein
MALAASLTVRLGWLALVILALSKLDKIANLHVASDSVGSS